MWMFALLPYWYGHDSMILLQLVCYAHWCWSTKESCYQIVQSFEMKLSSCIHLNSISVSQNQLPLISTCLHDCTIFLFLELLYSSISSSNLLIDFADSWNWCIERARWDALQGAHINWTNQHRQARVVVRSFCSAHRPKMQCGKQWNLDTQFQSCSCYLCHRPGNWRSNWRPKTALHDEWTAMQCPQSK